MFKNYTQTELVIIKKEALETENKHAYCGQLMQTKPMLKLEINRRMRLSWNAVGKQGNILRGDLREKRGKGFQLVRSPLYGIWVRIMDSESLWRGYSEVFKEEWRNLCRVRIKWIRKL